MKSAIRWSTLLYRGWIRRQGWVVGLMEFATEEEAKEHLRIHGEAYVKEFNGDLPIAFEVVPYPTVDQVWEWQRSM